MKLNRVLIPMLSLGLACGLYANTANPIAKADPKVQKLLRKNKLEIVDTVYVKEKIGKGVRSSAKAIIIDARPSKKYSVGHVPTAINISDGKFKEEVVQLKDVTKDQALITYCGGWKCAKAPTVASLLKAEGYKNVKVYQAGYPAWKKAGHYSDVSTPVVKSAVKKGNAVIIDARPEKVFKASRIKGAINIPDSKFDSMTDKLPKDKKAKIIVYCGGFKCGKSHIVADNLLKLGYNNVSVYAAGLPVWEKAALPMEGKRVEKSANKTEKSSGAEFIEVNGIQLVADQDENHGMVHGPWYKEMLKSVPKNIVLVDVRAADSYKSGHFPDAINIPFDNKDEKGFIEKIKKLNKIVIMNCAAGAMSTEAMMAVKKHMGDNAKVYYIDANFDCDKNNKCEIKVNEPL